MIVLHHLNNSRSQRVLWLLEELGLDYEIIRYERDPLTLMAPQALRAVHPLGKSPVITDEGNVVAESGAILDYILERYGRGRLMPAAGTPEALRYRFWLHYAEGSAMPPLLLKLIFQRMPKGPIPAFLKPIVRMIAKKAQDSFIDPQLSLHVGFWEDELGKSEWFAGNEFTAADIQMSFPVEAAASRVGYGPDRPRLKAYLERIRARPAYRRAIEQGGPVEIVR